MGLTKEQKRAAEAAALLKNLTDAQVAFDTLGEDATAEQKEAAKALVDAAQAAIDAAAEKPLGKNKKVKFLLSPVRKFSLGYSVGEIGLIEEKQAAELVEAKYAEYVK